MSVDSRIVDLKFNWSSFEQGVAGVLRGVAALAKGLQLNGASKGMDAVSSKARTVPAALSSISTAAGGIGSSISAMSTIATGALLQIGSSAIQAGSQMANAFTGAPIAQGFQEYETKMKSIQTILANTSRHGTGLETVNAELENLNKYADKTIYNFSEMTKNASLFTNSGMKIEDATQVIKGFSNAAAASGTGATEAAGAAFQLSQAFAVGKITLMDWKSLTNRGMGNKNMQDSLVQLAQGMGTFNSETTSAEVVQKDFNGSLEKGWLTADVMSTYLQAMTGDMTDQQLAAKGLTAEQVKGLQAQAQTALDSATKVRTFTQLMETTKEAIASGWTTTFETIFGGFDEATDLFTKVGDKVSGFVNGMSDSRNAMLGVWKGMGGRDVLIKGIGDAFTGVLSIIKPVKEAFRQLFPKTTGAELFSLTEKFAAFTAKLKIGADTAENIKRTFAGVFAVFSIAGQIIGGAVSAIGSLLGVVGKGSGGFLNFTAGIGMFLVNLDLMLKKSGIITTFFGGLVQVLALPLAALQKLGGFLAGLFDGFDSGGIGKVTGALDSVGKRMSPLQALGERLRGMFSTLGGMVKAAMSKIGEALSTVGDVIGDAFANANYSKVLDTLNTGLFAIIVLALKKFMAGGLTINAGGGIFDSIRGALDGVTETLGNMQANLKSDILLKIAAALALLTVSIVALSLIDAASLSKALIALSAGFILMSAGLSYLANSTSLLGSIKMLPIAASLLILGGALILMAGAMKIMAFMSWTDIGQGLVGIGGSLVVIAAAMRLMPKGMVAQAAAIAILGGALIILAGAVKLFASIDMATLVQGLAGIAASLVVLAIGMRLMPKDMVLQAVAIGVLAGALILLAGAVRLFAAMSLEQIGTGLLGIGASLAVIAVGLRLIPVTLVAQAAALVLVAFAIGMIAGAIKLMGTMSMEQMSVGLIALGGAMLILAAGLNMMTGAIGGAAALLVAAAALAILTPVLITLGTLSWGTIIQGLLVMAAAFAIVAAAGYLLTPTVPLILAFGAAVLMVGLGIAAAGVGFIALAKAFQIFVGTVGGIITAIIGAFKAMGPAIGAALGFIGKALAGAAKSVASSAGQFISATVAIMGGIASSIGRGVVGVVSAFGRMISSGVSKVRSGVGSFVSAGVSLISSMISAMTSRISSIVSVGAAGISRLASSIRSGVGQMVSAASSVISSFISTVRGALSSGASSAGSAARGIGSAIVQGIAGAISGGLSMVTGAARRLASSALSAAKGLLGIKSPSKEFEKVGKYVVEGFAKGLKGDQASVKEVYKTMNDLIMSSMSAADAAIKKHTDRLESLRGSNAKTVRSAQENLAKLQSAKKKDAGAIAKAQRTLTEATKKDTKAIKETTAALAQARAERNKLGLAHKEHNKNLLDEEMKLESLAIQHGKVKDEIKEQTKVLEDAIKTRDDYAKSLTDQFRNLPDVTKDTKLPKYIEELQKKVGETQAFSTAIQKLRDLGLNDTMYKELLAKGTEANPFLSQLLDGGKTAVDVVNKLGSQLDLASSKIGISASISLYQAGVDAAQGLLNGLKSKESSIVKQMEVLAAAMVNALKKKLGIKSPSREFAKLGAFSAEGFAQGFQTSGSAVKAAGTVGDQALEAMRQSLSGIGSLVSEGMDLSPVITPVLDLSAVQKDARTVGGLFTGSALSVDSSYSKAKSAMKGYEDSRAGSGENPPGVIPVNQTTFNQTNISPKALSEAEIYRSTKSALSRERGKVT